SRRRRRKSGCPAAPGAASGGCAALATPARVTKMAMMAAKDLTWSPRSLQRQQHQDVSPSARQRLERFADHGAGLVELAPVDLHRLGDHGRSARVAGDEQVSDLDRMLR